MTAFRIFLLQTALSSVVFALLAIDFVAPAVATLPLATAIPPLLIPHLFRHAGMSNLTGLVTDPNLPRAFAKPQAYGDLIAMVLAVICFLALRFAPLPAARVSLWAFTLWGTGDLVYAVVTGVKVRLYEYKLGFFWFTPTFYVPLLLASHALIAWKLLTA